MTAHPPTDSRFPEDGSLVGAWLVQERIGSGNHGVVFRVVHADRPNGASYALKLAKEPDDARFEREAWLLSRVRHPAVPRFEDTGLWTSPRGRHYPYLVMQWVEGVPLYDWATVHGLTLRQAIGQLAQGARALEAIHRHGVHRDVKGGNVRVTPDGRVVLLDFGSCWYPEAMPLTDGGMPPGTRPYRSPGQLLFEYALRLGAKADYEAEPEDDVYALGVTAYRLLASTYPPTDSDPLPPRGVAECCPELSALVLRMLSEDPLARGSATKVAEELERLFRQANPLLDGAWIERASMEPTEKTRRQAPRQFAVGELAPGFAAAAVVVVLVLLWVLLPPNENRREEAYTEAPRSAPQVTGSPDAGTAGTGEEEKASVAPAEAPPVSGRALPRKVLKGPLPGQKRPPCTARGEVELQGGCWWVIEGAWKPPCEANKYEHQGRCYAPVTNADDRAPTSDDP